MTRDELKHLIDLIVAEVAAATGRPRRLCSCHAVVDDCCPDRLRGVLDAGATRVGLHAAGGAPAEVAAMIDHTLLKPDASRQSVTDLCREAAQFRFATVCVNPTWVATCAKLLQGTGVGSWLLQRIDEVARARGLGGLSLETAEMAVANIRLYQRHGFEIVSRGPPDHGLDPHTRVYMVKSF